MSNVAKSMFLVLMLAVAPRVLAQAKPAPAAAAAADAASGAAEVPPVAEEPGVAEEPVAAEPAVGPATTQAAKGEPSNVVIAKQVLAEHFGEFAQSIVRDAGLEPAGFRQAAALLRASTMINKYDARSWRLLLDTATQLGADEEAIEALRGYLEVVENDSTAAIELYERYAARIQSVDKELEWLRDLLKTTRRSDEVRSHIAEMIARRLLDRGERKAAAEMLDEAVKLYPVNVSALDLKYQMLAPDANAQDRADVLLALLRANPTRPAVVAEFGRLLASVGMAKESAEWLNRSLSLVKSDRVDREFFHDVLLDYVAQLYIAGQIQSARIGTDQILKVSPGNVDAAFLRAIIERSGNEEAYKSARQNAAVALAARWIGVARYISGEAPPASQPSAAEGAAAGAEPPAAELPDPAVVAQQARQSQDPAKLAAFASAATDLAWFEIYFNFNPEHPENVTKWIDALKTVVRPDDAGLNRLRGWLQLLSKQTAGARKTLEAQADIDPLSALGLIRLNAGDKNKQVQQAVDERARKLLRNYPSGLLGTVLVQALKDRGLKLEPHPDAAPIRAQLQKFPRGWMELGTNPGQYYSVKVEPLQGRISHKFGEPMFVAVTIENRSDQYITIGDDGIIKPGLWFEAEAQVMRAQRISGTAFERLAQTGVPPKGRVGQYVRIDQGGLAKILNRDPTPHIQVSGWCITNPAGSNRGFGPGVAGMQVPFAKKLVRVGFPIAKPQVLRKALQEMDEGGPDAKMRNLSLLGAYVPMFIAKAQALQAPPPPPAPGAVAPDPAAPGQRQADAQQALATAESMVDNITRVAGDENPIVAGWAKFQLALLSDSARRQGYVEALLSESRWELQLLGLIATRGLPIEQAKAVVTKVLEAKDKEPVVEAYAAAQLELLKRPPADPAATQPVAEGAALTEPEAIPAAAAVEATVEPAAPTPADASGDAPETEEPTAKSN